MNCKNCNTVLNDKDKFCNNCGAKIVTERITIKSLFSNLLVALGWDSNFFVTLRYLLIKPQTVFKEYINGTRKKYANPFTFFAINLAISLFIYNNYSEQFIQLSTNAKIQKVDIMEDTMHHNDKKIRSEEIFGFKNQEEFGKAVTMYILKYYNIYSFLLLPLYTLIAFLVFRKPYNYGEHLVINTYIQSISIFLGVLIFVFSVLTGINLFGAGITIIAFLYYSYAYKKLYDLTYGKLLIKILKFIGIILLAIIIVVIITFIIGIAFSIIKSKF